MWAIRQVWLKFNRLKEYHTTEHEEGLSASDFAPFAQLFRAGSVRNFNFVAKTNRLRHRFGPLAACLRWIDYFILTAIPPLRRYCTTAVCCFDK